MKQNTLTALIALFTIIVVANLVALNYTMFRLLPQQLIHSGPKETPLIPEPAPLVPTNQDSCGIACQQAIQAALIGVDKKIGTLSAQTKSTAPQASSTPVPGVKEFFVPMGSGSTTKNDWEDIAGSDVFIDTANFPNIKQAYFEVSMRIPTKNGTVYARLYNVTDKHPVWGSDVSATSDTSTFTTAKITLDPGNKQYRIQMKTTLQYQSLVDNARVKILTQ
jgi:hypothetical protein